MKSKAKRNNNRPASFREKCRNAFAGALKGLANINAAEKENVAASFDLDKRSVERRIDAMEKNRAVAKRIAEGCIKGDPSFNFDDEWIAINILMDPPYNVGEEMFCYSLAAAIWILDAIRANQKMDEALALLPKDKDKLNSVRLPKCVSPCYSEAVLRSMVYTILHRNEDCVGLIKSPKDPARVYVTDGYTIAGKQHQDVPSRQVFDGILALLPEDMVDNAVNTFAFMSKAALSRYFTCRNKWIKKEIKFAQELRKKTEELKVISEESVKLSEKAKAAFAGKSIQQRIEGVPLIDDKMQVAAEVFDLKSRSDEIIDDDFVSRCGVNTKTFDPSMTVAALECAALQRCSFLLSIKVRTPCTGHSVRGDFFLLFLLACLCELHRIRIVQAEMGLAGSRTSFSFPPNRKPSFLSAIFCICHHVCPLVHPNLPVTAFGWQFLTVATCSWS